MKCFVQLGFDWLKRAFHLAMNEKAVAAHSYILFA